MASKQWDETSIPSQVERLAVITGAESRVGFEIARALAVCGASVVLAVRDTDAGRAAAARIAAIRSGAEITVQRLDLGSLASVRDAADALHAANPSIDLLINAASVQYPARTSTIDGFELQLGANHLGHFALTGLLLDRLLPVAGSRVVTVSSGSHRVRADIRFDDLQSERDYSRVAGYGQSKLANLLFAYELQQRLAAADARTISLAAHPGLANLRFGPDMPMAFRIGGALLGPFLSQPPARSALPILRAATDPSAVGGRFYGPGGFRETRGDPVLVTSSAASHDIAVRQRLWAVSEELTGVTFPPADLGADTTTTTPHHDNKEKQS